MPAHGVDRLSDGTELQFVEHLLDRQVKCLLVRDRDGLTDDWMKVIRSRSKRAMFIWPRDCLESYLIVPTAIHKVLQEELDDENVPTLKEVDELVSSILGNLYEQSQDRNAARLQDVEWRFNSHNRIDAAQANPIARAEMEKTWKQASNPLALAYGKELLSRVREAVQQKWNVSPLGTRV